VKEIKFSEPKIFYRRDAAKGKAIAPVKKELYEEEKMKKIMSISLMLIAFAFIYAVQAKAQTVKQMQFAKGKNYATVKGMTGNHGVIYMVRAKSGQMLTVTLTPTARVGIKIEKDSQYGGESVLLREEKGGTYEVGLEESGDYAIFVGSTNGKSIPFTLTVKIRKLADI
jgi:hypothetical protein